MKKISIILLLFSLFSIMIFSELKEYNGTGKIILQKYGCPEAPESSTCGRYKFISDIYHKAAAAFCQAAKLFLFQSDFRMRRQRLPLFRVQRGGFAVWVHRPCSWSRRL